MGTVIQMETYDSKVPSLLTYWSKITTRGSLRDWDLNVLFMRNDISVPGTSNWNVKQLFQTNMEYRFSAFECCSQIIKLSQCHKHIQFTCTFIILQTKVCTLKKKTFKCRFSKQTKRGKVVKSISCPLYKIIKTGWPLSGLLCKSQTSWLHFTLAGRSLYCLTKSFVITIWGTLV